MNPSTSAAGSGSRDSLRRRDWFVLGGILLLALLLRTVPLTFSHFWDETVFLQHARIIVGGRAYYDEFSSRPPILPILYAAGFMMWNSIYVANIVQGIVTTLGVLFGFLYARDSFGRTPGLIAAALIAFTPYVVEASHELLTDAPALTFMLAAMWALEKPRVGAALLSGALYGLAIETRFTSLFLVVYIVLQSMLVHRQIMRLAWWGAAAAVTIAPYLLWIRGRYGDFLHPFILARRVVMEWTAPVPAAFYADALTAIFPTSLWPLLVAGILVPLARAIAARQTEMAIAVPLPVTLADSKLLRVAVLMIWGLAFLAYMLSIPHKEVRYLLPLVIPVAMISAVGLSEVIHWVARRSRIVWAVAASICVAVAGLQYAGPLTKLTQPWVDSSIWDGAVQIGLYLQRVAAPDDVIYAAHEYPVLAFYSERDTISLLDIMDTFDEEWRTTMRAPGYFVYFHPAGIKETHSRNRSFKPDQSFLDSHPEFRAVQSFTLATVYRYDP